MAYTNVWDYNGTLSDDMKHLPDFDKQYMKPEQVLSHMPINKGAAEHWNNQIAQGHENHVMTALNHGHTPYIAEQLKRHGCAPAVNLHGLKVPWTRDALVKHKSDTLYELAKQAHQKGHRIRHFADMPDDEQATNIANQRLASEGHSVRVEHIHADHVRSPASGGGDTRATDTAASVVKARRELLKLY